jgi:hypothetical protein
MSDYEAIASWIAELNCPVREQREAAKDELLAVEPLIAAMQSGAKRQSYDAAHILSQIDDERWVALCPHS